MKIILNLIFLFVIFGTPAFSKKTQNTKLNNKDDFSDKLNIDNSKINRNKTLPMSLSPIIKNSKNSVISIKSTIIDKQKNDSTQMLDQFFKQFNLPDDVIDKFNHKKRTGIGSGVIITENGYAITNHHVVHNSEDITIKLHDKTRNYTAKIIGSDEESDIAVIKILPLTKGEKFSPISISDSDQIKVGDFVLAIGSPFDLPSSVTMGIISAKNRRKHGFSDNISMGDKNIGVENFIQTDASINIGNSGGPLIDIKGRLIGINTAIFSQNGTSSGVSFSIPINTVINISKHLVNNGVVQRGFLGVSGTDLDSSMAKYFNREELYGVIINEVKKDTPADKAGIKYLDLLLEINNKRIDDFTTLRYLVSNLTPNTPVKIKLQRKDKIINKKLILASSPQNKKILDLNDDEKEEPQLLKGVELADLDPTTKNSITSKNKDIIKNGIIVTKVKTDSKAYKNGLKVGDIITKIGENNINNINDAKKLITASASHGVIFIKIYRNNSNRLLAIEIE